MSVRQRLGVLVWVGATAWLGCGGDAVEPTGSSAQASSGSGAGGAGGGAACAANVTAKPGTVVTDRGAVTGVEAGSTWAFRNVPFAAPPVAELRWKPPAPHACWDGELDASKPGAACMQI